VQVSYYCSRSKNELLFKKSTGYGEIHESKLVKKNPAFQQFHEGFQGGSA